MSFFPPPRSGGPLRAARTGETYLAPHVQGNEWYNTILQRVDKTQRKEFNHFVRENENPSSSNKDQNARRKIDNFASALEQTLKSQNRRGAAAAHNAITLNAEIQHAVKYVFEKDLTGRPIFKRLLKFEMRDGFDPTNRLFLWFRLPFCCCSMEDTDLVDGYTTFDEPVMIVTKYLLIVLVLLFYILSLLWLSYGMQTMYACEQGQPSLSDQHLFITDKNNGNSLSCGDLLSRCVIPLGGMSIKSYYDVRVASYVLCTIPLLFLMASPCVLSARMLAPLNEVDADEATAPNNAAFINAKHVEAAQHCMNAVFCARESIQVNDFFDISAYWMLLTHWVGGILTICFDVALIKYIDSLGDACQSQKNWDSQPEKRLAVDPRDDACACSVLFGTADTRGLARVSSLELINPKSVALALVIPNFLYTLWAFLFVIQVWQFRNLGNRDSTGDDEETAAGGNASHEEDFEGGEYGDGGHSESMVGPTLTRGGESAIASPMLMSSQSIVASGGERGVSPTARRGRLSRSHSTLL